LRSAPCRDAELSGWLYTLQVAPEDCTGCQLCVEVCPVREAENPRRKAIHCEPKKRWLDEERRAYELFLTLPELDRSRIGALDVRRSQLLAPLFGASDACPGCGEASYLKLLAQLFGDRLLIANALGCAARVGGRVQATPYATDRDGRGPAWSCALLADDAELGFGFRLAIDSQTRHVQSLLIEHAHRVGEELVEEILSAEGTAMAAVAAQRRRIERVRARLDGSTAPSARRLAALADLLVPKSVWLVGGGDWAYDLGYVGLRHMLAAGRDTNVLVLDDPLGPAERPPKAKSLAVGGKPVPRKDLGLEVMGYGNVYVARVAFGAHMEQTIDALLEADAYPGPSLILAYSPCPLGGSHLGDGRVDGVRQQQQAVDSGDWPLYRFDPRRGAGEPPLRLDSPPSEPRAGGSEKTTLRCAGNHPAGWWQGLEKVAKYLDMA